MKRLRGKRALVTGGASGVGAAVAEHFVEEGARVIVADVADASAACRALGPSAQFVRLDISSATDWSAAFAAGAEYFGGVDVLVNNAAIFRPGTLAETSEEDFLAQVRVNQLGTFLGLREAAAHLFGGGSIVNTCSVAGSVGVTHAFAYAATKWAIRGMTKCAALELAERRIRVNSVHPGGVDTPMIAGASTRTDMDAIYAHQPIPRVSQPVEIARAISFLASDESSYITGAELMVDGGLSVA